MTVAPRTRPISSNDQLRIGLVQRQPHKKRVILNLPNIETALQKAFPKAWITNTTLDGMTLGEQARYFASQDIIVAAHGAALTSCVFLQPGSLVVQLYPKHYFPVYFFEPLIRQVNSHVFSWYAGHSKDPLQDYLTNLPDRSTNRLANVKPPVDEIVAMIVNATRNINLIEK